MKTAWAKVLFFWVSDMSYKNDYDADMFNENSQYTIEWVIINIYYPTEGHTIQKVSAS